MLVLSRKKNESIVINGDIRIEVLQIKGKQIRLGITAPSSVKVLRGELPMETQRSGAAGHSGPAGSGKRLETQIVEGNLDCLTASLLPA